MWAIPGAAHVFREVQREGVAAIAHFEAGVVFVLHDQLEPERFVERNRTFEIECRNGNLIEPHAPKD
jgi:hypothetical protein